MAIPLAITSALLTALFFAGPVAADAPACESDAPAYANAQCGQGADGNVCFLYAGANTPLAEGGYCIYVVGDSQGLMPSCNVRLAETCIP